MGSEPTPGGSSGGACRRRCRHRGACARQRPRRLNPIPGLCLRNLLGIRPTLGRVPNYEQTSVNEPSIATQLTNVQGPLARSVRDLRLELAAMQPRDARDPWWSPAYDEPVTQHPIRVAMFVNPPGANIDPAVHQAVINAARWLEDAGYQIEEIAPPHFEEAARLFFTLVRTEEKAGTNSSH